jgi:hypothetical protein
MGTVLPNQYGGDSMAIHTLNYYGHMDTSFHRLAPNQRLCWLKDGTDGHVEALPAGIDGIEFGVMQGQQDHFFVKAADVILRAPVLFIGGRHGPAAPGPAWPKLDDDVAVRILVDLIVSNPELRDVLGGMIRALGTRS